MNAQIDWQAQLDLRDRMVKQQAGVAEFWRRRAARLEELLLLEKGWDDERLAEEMAAVNEAVDAAVAGDA